MNITKFNSGLDLFPALFNTFDSIPEFGSQRSFLPPTDVSETDTAYEVHVSAAGLNKDDFTIKVDDNLLIISGERKKDEKKFNLKENVYSKFVRKFTLPNEVKVEDISASYVNGILNIIIPKDEKKLKSKLIEIT